MTGRIITISDSVWRSGEGAHLGERRLELSFGCINFEGTPHRWRYLSCRILEMGNLHCGVCWDTPPHLPHGELGRPQPSVPKNTLQLLKLSHRCLSWGCFGLNEKNEKNPSLNPSPKVSQEARALCKWCLWAS